MNQIIYTLSLSAVLLLQGCTSMNLQLPDRVQSAQLQSATPIYNELIALPKPRGKIPVAVYNFRDQTGQYKHTPTVSTFSTSITQGSTSILLQALKESDWFIPVEREGLNNLLTERKIIRSALKSEPSNKDRDLAPLQSANILIEGGITGYDSNIITGGTGLRYFGIGGSHQYRIDQVTVHLRAIDINSGRILNSVSTTKSIYSIEVKSGVYQFVSFKRLLEFESGYSTNQPGLICVTEAIEKAVLSLIIEGILDKHWYLKEESDINAEVINEYLDEKNNRTLSSDLYKKLTSTPIKRMGPAHK